MSVIDSTCIDLEQTVARMLSLLDQTPDDKADWRPSPSSRSIVEIVAHSALSLRNIRMQMEGNAFEPPNSAEANAQFLDHDRQFTGKAAARRALESASEEYIAFVRSQDANTLKRMVKLPFGLGEAPIEFFMKFGNLHTMGHIGQIEYVQTMYGDHNWHTGF